VDVTLTPETHCVLEERFNVGITAVIKTKGAPDVVLHSRVWKAIMDKKELLKSILSKTPCSSAMPHPVGPKTP